MSNTTYFKIIYKNNSGKCANAGFTLVVEN